MRYKDYLKLSPHHRAELWRSLLDNPAWEVLQDMVEDQRKSLQGITDRDSKEKFLFETAQWMGKANLLALPEQLIATARKAIDKNSQ